MNKKNKMVTKIRGLRFYVLQNKLCYKIKKSGMFLEHKAKFCYKYLSDLMKQSAI